MNDVPGRRLDDAELVRREFSTEERLVRRRLDNWAVVDPAYDAEGRTLDLLRRQRPARVLEIGPGTGEFTVRMRAALDAEIVAVDISERLVALVRERGVEAVVGDVQALPFASRDFDAVVAHFVLHFVPDLDGALREIHRVLRDGGRFLVTTAHADHLAEVWRLVGHRFPASPFDCHAAEYAIRRLFVHVERHEVTGGVRFPNREALAGYLDAFELLTDGSLAGRVPDAIGSFQATARRCLLVAHR
jgi:SAM-dependent methyltransferase